MKRIAVLVDMTENGKPALRYARILAEKSGAALYLIHVADDDVPSEIHENMIEEYARPEFGDALQIKSVLGRGNYLSELPHLIERAKPDLVVACTHGIHGIAQNLFGAHILKLVQAIHHPTLVVQENSTPDPKGIERILLPASPFADFKIKMKQCAELALIFGAEVVYYEIDKYLGDTEEAVASNGKLAEEYMSKAGVKFRAILEENRDMSLGHAHQTLAFARDNQMSLIGLTSNTHHEYMAMGKADKEKFLTNKQGIPVMCCNE